jgi:hypothetical protein
MVQSLLPACGALPETTPAADDARAAHRIVLRLT